MSAKGKQKSSPWALKLRLIFPTISRIVHVFGLKSISLNNNLDNLFQQHCARINTLERQVNGIADRCLTGCEEQRWPLEVRNQIVIWKQKYALCEGYKNIYKYFGCYIWCYGCRHHVSLYLLTHLSKLRFVIISTDTISAIAAIIHQITSNVLRTVLWT